jgi:hypothetical protein
MAKPNFRFNNYTHSYLKLNETDAHNVPTEPSIYLNPTLLRPKSNTEKIIFFFKPKSRSRNFLAWTIKADTKFTTICQLSIRLLFIIHLLYPINSSI